MQLKHIATRVIGFIKKHKEIILVSFFFLFLTYFYLKPMFQGLMLLPLDLLISNYMPWYSPGTILLKNPYMQDSIIQMYPWHHLVFQSFQNGIIPFWNPYQFMGMPFMAGMKPMVFYPFNLLFILGEINSWNALLFLQIFFSLVFTYVLARDFKLPKLPSIMVALAFSLNSLMISVLEFGSEGHVLLWIPLFIFFSKRFLDTQKPGYLLLLGLVIAISIFGGQLQYTAYGLCALVFFILIYGRHLKTPFRNYFYLVLSLMLGAGITAVQMIPSLELFSASNRGVAEHAKEMFTNGLINPKLLFRLFSPDFFGNPVSRDAAIGYIESSGYFGIIPLFFALYAIIFNRKNIFVKLFSFIFVLALLFSLKQIGEIVYLLKIPLLSSGSGGRVFSLVYLSGSILAGFGIVSFFQAKIKNNILSLISFLALFALIILTNAYLLKDIAQIKNFLFNIRFSVIIFSAFTIASLVFFFLKNKYSTKLTTNLFLIFIVFLIFFDLYRFGYRFLTFSNPKFNYPETSVSKFVKDYSQNNLTRVAGLSEPELPTYLNYYSVETYNPLYPSRNANLILALEGIPNAVSATDNKFFLTAKGQKLKDTMNFLGIGLLVNNKDGNPASDFFGSMKFQDGLNNLYKDEKYAVYHNIEAFPRYYLVYETKLIKDEKEILNSLAKSSKDFQKTIILEENLPVKLEKGEGRAKLLSNDLNNQKFEITTDKAALFYITDSYFPGWRATVNNNQAKIYRANYNFRAVLVPKGRSIVDFSYQPSNFILAICISFLSLVCLFALPFLKVIAGRRLKS